MAKITKRTIDSLKPGAADYFLWDDDMAGFGVRVMPSGRASYVVQYRAGGRTRRNAFSAVGKMTPDEARKYARSLLVAVDKGEDPVAELEAQRRMPNVAALCKRFLTDHVAFRCKPSTQGEYGRSVELFIKPSLGTFKVGDVKRTDIAKLHHDMNAIPYQANRTLGVLSKMFNLAEVWGLRPDGSNPCRHVRKYPERKRERYLTVEEMGRLGAVLSEGERDGTEPASVIAAIRLLMLTGARLGEIQTLKWDYVRDGYIAFPNSKTGAKRIELGAEAQDTLGRIERMAGNPYVIVGTVEGQHWTDLQRPWRRIRAKAELPDLRIHDLRHSFASLAASDGESLQIIGKLLGHSQVQTTARYAHLAPAPVRATADRLASSIAKAMSPKPSLPQAVNSNEPLKTSVAE
ncbi:MAG TPA: site-specific integrase [Candidatus Binataceae bacterium]|nr:site-specific integrase [Candidatus Binataceae bacterium]